MSTRRNTGERRDTRKTDVFYPEVSNVMRGQIFLTVSLNVTRHEFSPAGNEARTALTLPGGSGKAGITAS